MVVDMPLGVGRGTSHAWKAMYWYSKHYSHYNKVTTEAITTIIKLFKV